MPLIIIENNSSGVIPKTTDGRVPVGSDILLPKSLEMNNSEDQGVLSAPISPNRVRKGHSQDMPAEGSIFDVSPDIPGFHMRPAGGGVQPADITQPPPPSYVGFNNPFFGAPIAFAQCQNTSDSSIGIDQSAVPTLYASGVSPDTIPWSTAEDIIRDIVREGPFDVDTAPMDTEDSPFINASMPGCPYRMTSYTGTAMVDADTRSTASPSMVSGVHRSSGVGKTFESVSIVLGGQVRTRKCYGGRRKPTKGRWVHDVEPSNSGTVRNGVASDVSRNVEHWCGPCGVSCRRGRQTIGYAKGSASGQVYDSDGPVAPSVWSGSDRAVTNVDLHFLYEL